MQNAKREYREELGRRLEVFIRAKGWGKSQFGGLVGVLPSHVSRYLRGTLDPLNLLDKLLELGIDKEWFLSGKGDSPKYEMKNIKIYGSGTGAQHIGSLNTNIELTNLLEEYKQLYASAKKENQDIKEEYQKEIQVLRQRLAKYEGVTGDLA